MHFNFNENGRKYLKLIENTVGKKGEIVRTEKFLHFKQRIQKTCTSDTYKHGLGKGYFRLPQTGYFNLPSAVCTCRTFHLRVLNQIIALSWVLLSTMLQ